LHIIYKDKTIRNWYHKLIAPTYI